MTRLSRPLLQWIVLFLLLILFSAATGRLQGKMVPDSASYLSYPFDSLDAALRSTRTLGYPLLLRVVDTTLGLAMMPCVQVLIQSIASWCLLRELLRWQVSSWAGWAAALAVAFSSTTLDNVAILSTDSIAASLGVMSAVCLLAWVRELRDAHRHVNRTRFVGATASLFALLAITMRPAYLSLILWLPIAGTLLLTMRCTGRSTITWIAALKSSLVLGLLVAMPIGGWIVLRGFLVQDFSVLPFGHQNLAGITIQLVNDEELAATKGAPGELAKEIVEYKKAYNDSARNRLSNEDYSTMAMEARWDDYVWRVVVPATSKRYGDDAIANHRAIAALNRDILKRYPLRYGRWLLLGMRRAIWGTAANMLLHPLFLPCLLGVIVLHFHRSHQGPVSLQSDLSDGLRALSILAITYFLVQVSFVVLTSPPVGRFADAAAILIPGWIAALIASVLRTQRLRDSVPVR